MNNQLEPYLEDLISNRFKEEELKPEIKEQLRAEILGQLDSFLRDQAIEALSDEDAEKFGQLLTDKKSPEELQQFLQTHIPEYQEFMIACLGDFRDMYLMQ